METWAMGTRVNPVTVEVESVAMDDSHSETHDYGNRSCRRHHRHRHCYRPKPFRVPLLEQGAHCQRNSSFQCHHYHADVSQVQ